MIHLFSRWKRKESTGMLSLLTTESLAALGRSQFFVGTRRFSRQAGRSGDLVGRNYLIPTLQVELISKENIDQVLERVHAKVQTAPLFYSRIPVVVEVTRMADLAGGSAGDNPSESPDVDGLLNHLVSQLQAFDLHPAGVTSSVREIAQFLRTHGRLPLCSTSKSQTTRLKDSAPPATVQRSVPGSAQSPSSSTDSSETRNVSKPPKIVEGHVRAGQQIYAEDSDLVVFGSVHPGAEAIADGSVHVFGSLMGRALAGFSGASEARIFANVFRPQLVSISNVYMVADEIPEAAHSGSNPIMVQLIEIPGGTLPHVTVKSFSDSAVMTSGDVSTSFQSTSESYHGHGALPAVAVLPPSPEAMPMTRSTVEKQGRYDRTSAAESSDSGDKDDDSNGSGSSSVRRPSAHLRYVSLDSISCSNSR